MTGKTESSKLRTSNTHREANISMRRAAHFIGLGYVATMAVLIPLGLLLTRTFETTSLVKWDESAVRYFSDHRTPTQTQWSTFWSRSGDAPTIIAIAVFVGFILAIGRNWHELIWLAVIVPTELAFFLTISYAVDRPRPDVAHVGSVPSTGSFPSGHVAVTVVLYGTLAMILAAHVPSRASRTVSILSWSWTVTAACFVGWARMYRGMHHPLDVGAGAVLGCAVFYVGFRLFSPSEPHVRSGTTSTQPLLATDPALRNTLPKENSHEATN